MEIMLTILLISAMIGQGRSWDSYGTYFITVFPENIAYYYPLEPVNTLNLTALFPNTEVQVLAGAYTYTYTLTAGKPLTVSLPVDIEEYKLGYTSQTVRINSSEVIVAQSISKKGKSVQTNVIPPYKYHRTNVTIPSLNYSQMMNNFHQSSKNISKRYSSFRLIIINGHNFIQIVTVVKQARNEVYTLDAYGAVQLQTDGTETAIYSSNRVAVMLTHPCVETKECSCNMVVNHLFPDPVLGNRFIVPSILSTSNFWLHVTSSVITTARGGDLGSTTVNAYSSDLLPISSLQSQFINTSSTVSLQLIAPGIIIQLISENLFSACYLAPVTSKDATALIIAETLYKNSVYIDGNLLLSEAWSTIPNSVYSSVSVHLDDVHVIWHPSRNIGVYVFEKAAHVYGGPAIALSGTPDPLGCAVFLPTFDIVATPQTWPGSHQNCMLISDELFSPNNQADHVEMVNFLKNNIANDRFWIGVRRSLLTLDWYQQKGNSSQSLTYTQWGTGEPDIAVKGMCVSVFQSPSMVFQWETVPCCTLLKSICYTKALYFSL